MNLRWKMLKHGMSDSPLYLPVNFVFLMSYIICRVVFMGMCLVRTYQIMHAFDIYSDPPFISTCAIATVALQVMLYLIQLFWFWLIIGAVAKTLQGKKPAIASKDD